MIVDHIENWNKYPFGSGWKLAFEFLTSLTPDAEEKEYSIQGHDIFALITKYETRLPESAALEAHRQYVDIQAVLNGRERIEWSWADGLLVDKKYDMKKDVEFYKRPKSGHACIDLYPGLFTALFPQDAHMPSLTTEGIPELTKKIVIKLKQELLKP